MMNKEWIQEAWQLSVKKLEKTSLRIGASFPHVSLKGQYDTSKIEWWTNGFWPGIMWLLYQDTKNPFFQTIAQECEEKLDQGVRDFYGLHHDVGFMWLLTSVMNYQVTGNEESRKRGLMAASLLSSRFNVKGGYIRAWNHDKVGWSIIDTMMNLPILNWASRETNDPRFSHIAEIHADTVLKHFVRADGSVYHILEFDPHDGKLLNTPDGQGYDPESSWTRGQAWALYGFIRAFVNMKHTRYLDGAEKIAEYFISNIPQDGVIPSDFRCPAEGKVIHDATAAACAASGFIDIANVQTGRKKQYFLGKACFLLESLYQNSWSDSPDEEGLITRGTMAYHTKEGQNKPLIYGDFFFLEALAKLRGMNRSFW